MKRRDFLKFSPALSLPFLLNGLPLTAKAGNPLLYLLREQTINNGRVLVLIQMNGGNDGLNTLLPLDQYSNLSKARSNILIPQNRALSLSGVPQTGLHPSMTGIQNMYNSGQVNILQAAGYANPSFSHFRATDILLTGSASDSFLSTGWLGRTLETEYPGYPGGYPNTEMPDPLSIQIGSQASLVTQCTAINAAVTVTNPSTFYELINGVSGSVPDSPYGHELTFVRLIKQQTSEYTTVIKNAFNATSGNTVTYPSNNTLADQLQIVARLIKGGLKTPIYVVNHPNSFDTHASQVDTTDVTRGNHANMLAVLSDAVSAFQQDLINMQISDRVAAMTLTEFGRRIKSNDSLGSDHGAGTPMFFFGTNLNPVIIGTNPPIPNTVTVSDQVNMQHDIKAVYYTVLKDWFQLSDTDISTVFPDAYTVLPIFKQVALPVTLLSFTGNWVGKTVNLQWQTEHESGIDRYEVQRSDDGTSFVTIGTVSAINSSVKHTYNFADTSLSKSFYYYRIKIAEQSSAIEFSSILLLKANQSSAGNRVKIFPNPVTDKFTVSSEKKISGLVTVTIADINGREVWKQEKESIDSFDLSFSLAGKKPVAGIYFMRMYIKNEETTARIMIQ